MTKNQAISIASECAKLYKENLLNKDIMIIYKDELSVKHIHMTFEERNFKHLTGLQSPNVSAVNFYRKLLSGNLSPNLISFSNDGTTELKLQILKSAMNIDKLARMICTQDLKCGKLKTDKLAGTTSMSMGFVNGDNNIYIPNTLLKKDIRDLGKYKSIIAIYKKDRSENIYTKTSYINKRYVDEKFPKEIQDKIIL